MNFSKTTAYALRILALMANEDIELYSSDYLHKKLHIPKKYLQRLLTDLSKSGLIKSSRGKYGGFALAKSKKRITVAQIIDAVEGFSNIPSCFFGFNKCALNNPCAMHDVWTKSQNELIHTLSTTKLTDLIKPK